MTCSHCRALLAVQVFNFVDSTTLCTTVPLVCKLWHKAATDSQLWTPQLPQQVLAVAAAHAAATATYCNRHNKSQLIVARGQLPLNFPQMHHAIYSRNFLRNPGFCQSHNSDYMRLIRMRPTSWVNKQGPRGAAGLGLNSQSNISNEQRRLAWVSGTATSCCAFCPYELLGSRTVALVLQLRTA